jgi:hypothetical protein
MLAANKALEINACPLTPINVNHDVSGGIRHNKSNPSLIIRIARINKDVVGNVILVSIILL